MTLYAGREKKMYSIREVKALLEHERGKVIDKLESELDLNNIAELGPCYKIIFLPSWP